MIKYANGIYEKRKQSNLLVFVLKIRLIIQYAYLAANMAFEKCKNGKLRLFVRCFFWRVEYVTILSINKWMRFLIFHFFLWWQKNNEQSFIIFMLLFVIIWLQFFLRYRIMTWICSWTFLVLNRWMPCQRLTKFSNHHHQHHYHGSITMIYFFVIVHIV